MKKRLYVAYGSNLNFRQMKRRCPTAKLYGTGTIEGYELQFKGAPDSAFATIAPKEGASVPAAVWEITPKDERSLDRYEGYPSHYFKKTVTVSLDGRDVDAMVYIMDLKMKFGMPSPYYYATVLEGYCDCELDIDMLDRAVKDSAQRFYHYVVGLYKQQMLFDCGDNEPEESEEGLDEEPDESDPFYFSDGMRL